MYTAEIIDLQYKTYRVTFTETAIFRNYTFSDTALKLDTNDISIAIKKFYHYFTVEYSRDYKWSI